MDRALAKLMETVYWVGMTRKVGHCCSHCKTCQTTKSQPRPPDPLQPVVASCPWVMVAVDILKVPVSHQGNEYLLVVQDYFLKWPFVMPMPDQKAERIVKILRDHIFTLVGPKSQVLADICKAFKIVKSYTTPYHPMGDALVERINRTLLSLFQSYTQSAGDWEEHLQLLLFAYRTTKHSSIGFEVLFGYNPPSPILPNQNVSCAAELADYSAGNC